jgi:hypothetical protein
MTAGLKLFAGQYIREALNKSIMDFSEHEKQKMSACNITSGLFFIFNAKRR